MLIPGLAPFRLTLRAERPGDRGHARTVYGAGRAAELARVPWPEAAKQAFLDDQFRLQSEHFSRAYPDAARWVVERDSTAIGRFYVSRTGPSWRLIEIGLFAEARGDGIGTTLIRWLLGEARKAGAERVELAVARDNPGAARLYARLGFAAMPGDSATHLTLAHQLNTA